MSAEEIDRNPVFAQKSHDSAQKTAEELYMELAEREGTRILFIIVDDHYSSRAGGQMALRAGTRRSGLDSGVVFSTHARGSDAIRVYQGFRELDETGRPTPVVMVLDGHLGQDTAPELYKTGLQVADKATALSRDFDWPVPYFVGASANTFMNEALQAAHQDQYLGNLDMMDVVIAGLQTRLVQR